MEQIYSFFENLGLGFLTNYIVFLVVAILFLIILKILHVSTKTIVKLLINIIVGGVVLFLINFIPGINVPIDIIRCLIVGICGLPGAVIVVILHLLEIW